MVELASTHLWLCTHMHMYLNMVNCLTVAILPMCRHVRTNKGIVFLCCSALQTVVCVYAWSFVFKIARVHLHTVRVYDWTIVAVQVRTYGSGWVCSRMCTYRSVLASICIDTCSWVNKLLYGILYSRGVSVCKCTCTCGCNRVLVCKYKYIDLWATSLP